MIYKHYILTRFNLGIYDNTSAYAEKVKDADKWMQHRIALFEKYCLPSVMNQTCKEFTWVLAFDRKTPDNFIEAYDYLDNVKICFTAPMDWMRSQLPEADWLITSRMDNDDMYRPDFVQQVQQAFEFRVGIIDIDYEVMDIHTGKRYKSMRRAANSPFLSLVEEWKENPCTALGHPHSNMIEYYEWVKLGTLATQIIHDRNIMNKITKEEI